MTLTDILLGLFVVVVSIWIVIEAIILYKISRLRLKEDKLPFWEETPTFKNNKSVFFEPVSDKEKFSKAKNIGDLIEK